MSTHGVNECSGSGQAKTRIPKKRQRDKVRFAAENKCKSGKQGKIAQIDPQPTPTPTATPGNLAKANPVDVLEYPYAKRVGGLMDVRRFRWQSQALAEIFKPQIPQTH